MIDQEVLIALHDRWEPECSQSEPSYRAATCVDCAQPMDRMWHVWLNHESSVTGRLVTKELHFCSECGPKYGLEYGAAQAREDWKEDTLFCAACGVVLDVGGKPTNYQHSPLCIYSKREV
jgi:hypothetical protein